MNLSLTFFCLPSRAKNLFFLDFSALISFFFNLSTISLIISYICNKQILDSQCGYRRYKLSDVCTESFIENGFQFESEALIKLLGKKNNCLHHIKIPTIYEAKLN